MSSGFVSRCLRKVVRRGGTGISDHHVLLRIGWKIVVCPLGILPHSTPLAALPNPQMHEMGDAGHSVWGYLAQSRVFFALFVQSVKTCLKSLIASVLTIWIAI